MENPIVKRHQDMVTELVKPGAAISNELTEQKITMWYSAISQAYVAEQYLSAAKATVVYNKPVELDFRAMPPVSEFSEIMKEMTPEKADMLHAVTGVATEALELLSMVASHVLCEHPFDTKNFKEEMGDLEFYMEQARQAGKLSRDESLELNETKLRKRYSKGYSDTAAQVRADKKALEGSQ
jgi:hypothetical protein